MSLCEIKHLRSALEIEFFELYFLQPALDSHPVLSSHLAIPWEWLLKGSTVHVLNKCGNEKLLIYGQVAATSIKE